MPLIQTRLSSRLSSQEFGKFDTILLHTHSRNPRGKWNLSPMAMNNVRILYYIVNQQITFIVETSLPPKLTPFADKLLRAFLESTDKSNEQLSCTPANSENQLFRKKNDKQLQKVNTRREIRMQTSSNIRLHMTRLHSSLETWDIWNSKNFSIF